MCTVSLTGITGSVPVQGSEKLSEAQWKKLREILESSAPHGTEPTRRDPPEGGGGQEPQTCGPGAARCLDTLCNEYQAAGVRGQRSG